MAEALERQYRIGEELRPDHSSTRYLADVDPPSWDSQCAAWYGETYAMLRKYDPTEAFMFKSVAPEPHGLMRNVSVSRSGSTRANLEVPLSKLRLIIGRAYERLNRSSATCCPNRRDGLIASMRLGDARDGGARVVVGLGIARRVTVRPMAKPRQIPTAESLLADTQKLFDLMSSASDLAVAIVTHSYLDAALGCLLRHRFVDAEASRALLDDMDGQLSSFGTRCRAARALGLISAVWYADLKKLGKIRNRFAHHHLALDFGDKQIGALCDGLSMNKDPINVATNKPIKVPHISEARRIRSRYLAWSVYLSQQLLQQVVAQPPKWGE